jgi:Rrf2 family nitric oxide-sensitive transcriptional repressor
MRLTKSTSHAIRILIDCGRAGDSLIKVAALSGRLEITPQNVFKIVSMLAKAGLIEAVRGRHGGVRLARRADQIRIGDVVRATEVTHVEIEEETHRDLRRSGHGVNRVLDDALEAFIEVLDQHTIADMVKTQAPPKAAARRKSRPAARAVAMGGGRARRTLLDPT